MRALYLMLLAACLLGTALPLTLLLGVRLSLRRLALTLLPVLAVFAAWDAWAITRGHWSYDLRQTTGWLLPGRLPVEEVAFFLVVPTCAVLALEAVRKVRGWPVGDE